MLLALLLATFAALAAPEQQALAREPGHGVKDGTGSGGEGGGTESGEDDDVTRSTQWTRPEEEATLEADAEQDQSRLENYERHSLLLSDVNLLGLDEDGFGFPDAVAEQNEPEEQGSPPRRRTRR